MLNLLMPDDDDARDSKQQSDAERDSVQNFPDARKEGASGANDFWTVVNERGAYLPAWGTRMRERTLRAYDRDEMNNLWQGARDGLIKKIVATPWELKGGRNTTNYFQRIIRDMGFNEYGGYTETMSKVVRDFLRFDGGAYIEVIAPGNPMRPPTGRITGLAHLDSYRCTPTGDPEYPVVYQSRSAGGKTGTLHLLHKNRVIHIVDSPDGDQDHPGYGMCALSRAMALVNREILMGRYILTSLDDKPAPGVVIANNITPETRDAMFARFAREQSTDEQPAWGRVVWGFNLKPDRDMTLQMFTFSAPPQNFDFKVYVEINIDELALALNVDRQEIAQLSGGNIGSAQQSQVQHAKSQGKMPGYLYQSIERAFNSALPEEVEFAYKVRDPYEEQERAATAQVWAGVSTAVGSNMTPDEKRQMLANQVEAIYDAITDENGEVVRLPDVDVTTPEQQQGVEGVPQPEGAPQPEATAQDDTPNAPNAAAQRKDFEETRARFEADLSDLLTSDADRRRAGVVMRALLNRLGKDARLDGLKEGGVQALSESDRSAHTVWLAEQSQFVGEFLTSAYRDRLTDAQIAQHAKMWASKSLAEAYYQGVMSADSDGTYEFYGSDGLESCKTCRTLQGTKMRMSEWAGRKLRPGVDTQSYECGGWACKHHLRRVT